jgi:hypothetical protein
MTVLPDRHKAGFSIGGGRRRSASARATASPRTARCWCISDGSGTRRICASCCRRSRASSARCRRRCSWSPAKVRRAPSSSASLASALGLDGHLLWLGYLDRERELAGCYRAGDAFVFTSKTETQGLVLLEAMALGVPVVALSEMGTRDLLVERRGALVAEDDLEDFAGKCLEMLRDPGLRARLAAEGPLVAADWSAAQMAKRLEALYRNLLD